jgi:hypothetical protein
VLEKFGSFGESLFVAEQLHPVETVGVRTDTPR